MKKTIIIVALIALFISGAALAGKDLSYRLSPENTGQLYSADLDRANVGLIKTVDGLNTCYITFVKINGITANSSVSCIKNDKTL